MLAIIQRVTTAAWLVLLLGAPALAVFHGRGGLAVVLALLIAAGQALWLGLTFLWMHSQNRGDRAPPASAWQMLGAWWAEARTAPQVFCWRQPFFANAEPDYLPTGPAGQRTGLVLVHGFFCNRGLWTPWLHELRRLGIPFVAVDLEPVFGSIDDYPPVVEAAVVRLRRATGRPPILIGHSMGGLAIRAWLRDFDADARVHSLITLGTPHSGTRLARLAFSTNGRQMRQSSPWLTALAAAEPAARRRSFLCFFSHCDNIVFPASHAVLADAEERHVPAAAHVDLLNQPGVMAEVLKRLHAADAGLRLAPID